MVLNQNPPDAQIPITPDVLREATQQLQPMKLPDDYSSKIATINETIERLKGAADTFQRAVSPDSPEFEGDRGLNTLKASNAHFRLGEANRRMGLLFEGKKDKRAGGVLEGARGEYKEAIKWGEDSYERLQGNNPLLALSKSGVGNARMRLAQMSEGNEREGFFNLAAKDFEEAVKIDPGNPAIFHQRGVFFKELLSNLPKGDERMMQTESDAIESLKAAKALYEKQGKGNNIAIAPTLYHLGLLMFEKTSHTIPDMKDGRALLRLALNLDPNNELADKARDKTQ
ncbi:MAG: hypothetical protein V1744_04680 [Candidatus Altiarchaeota archaeon]